MALTIDSKLCTGCGDCIDICAVEALSLVDNVLVVQQDECIECSACLDECSNGALSLNEATGEQSAARDAAVTPQ